MESVLYDVERLPKSVRREAYDFVEFLLERYENKMERRRPIFGWEGALKHIRNRYTSVELQHKASEWRENI